MDGFTRLKGDTTPQDHARKVGKDTKNIPPSVHQARSGHCRLQKRPRSSPCSNNLVIESLDEETVVLKTEPAKIGQSQRGWEIIADHVDDRPVCESPPFPAAFSRCAVLETTGLTHLLVIDISGLERSKIGLAALKGTR